MAKCKVCGKKGLFLKLYEKTACGDCHAEWQRAREEEPQRLADALARVDSDIELKDRVTAADRARKSAERLAPFEAAGLATDIDVSAAATAQRMRDFPGAAMGELVASELPSARARSQAAKTREAVMEPFQTLLTRLYELQPFIEDENAFERYAQQVREYLDGVDLEAAIKAAEMEEFKGNRPRAVELYLEALFLARKDAIDDGDQSSTIDTLRDKIINLGGELPPSEYS